MIELEKKLLLTREEYNYLLNHLGQDKPTVKQVNYYFDTDDLSMNRQNITCRIRLKDGKYTATIKQHTTNSEHSTETNMTVRNGVHDNIFADMGLSLQGDLTTERCIILKDSTCEVVLDRNDYLGYTDYELEIEYSSQGKQVANMLFKTLVDKLMENNSDLTLKDITGRTENTPCKSKRFFERWKKNDLNT